MVAYNFHKRFVEAIQSGEKTHTIRKDGKRRQVRQGERMQLYTAQRTKYCRKILDSDPVCVFTVRITITIGEEEIERITLDGNAVEDLEVFARSDGFDSLAAMHAYWVKFHGVGMFSGTFIEWDNDDSNPA
jgi:uncharacterized protein YqfB (UPF0267 family)